MKTNFLFANAGPQKAARRSQTLHHESEHTLLTDSMLTVRGLIETVKHAPRTLALSIGFVSAILTSPAQAQTLQVEERVVPYSIVLASVTVSGTGLRPFDQFWLQLQSTQDPKAPRQEVAIEHKKLDEKRALKANGEPIGRLIALSLPVGEYAVVGWRGTRYNRVGGSIFSGPVFDIAGNTSHTQAGRFTVAPGEYRYIGNIDFDLDRYTTRKTTIRDRTTRDLPLAEQVWNLPSASIEKKLIH